MLCRLVHVFLAQLFVIDCIEIFFFIKAIYIMIKTSVKFIYIMNNKKSYRLLEIPFEHNQNTVTEHPRIER